MDMNQEKAEEIARAFIQKMNPEKWNGEGNRPLSFSTILFTIDLSAPNSEKLDISFSFDATEQVWNHGCCLRGKELAHGYGVDSPLNIAETIQYVCGLR